MAKEKNERYSPTNEPELRDKKGTETHVVVEMPEEVVIKLVPENLVRNYDMLTWLFNASSSISVGLWTAFVTTDMKLLSSLFFSGLAFTIMSLVLLVLIRKNRKKTFSDPVRKKLKISEFHRD